MNRGNPYTPSTKTLKKNSKKKNVLLKFFFVQSRITGGGVFKSSVSSSNNLNKASMVSIGLSYVKQAFSMFVVSKVSLVIDFDSKCCSCEDDDDEDPESSCWSEDAVML